MAGTARGKTWGNVTGAEWSADEESLLFVEVTDPAGGRFSFLIVGTNDSEALLLSADRADSQTRFFGGSEDTHFYWRSLSGQTEVWVMALPPRETR